MSRYIPITEFQQKEMLQDLGLESVDQLFSDVPENVKLNRKLDIPAPLDEHELLKHMRNLSKKNGNLNDYICFLGAGCYDHYIPSIVWNLLSRQEFYTSYTPYQPEISQGTLQGIFEYQTMICELTGMDVSNASVYDGATAVAEAAMMACSTTGRSELLIARSLHPESKEVLNTYGRFRGYRITEVGYKEGQIDVEDLESKLSTEVAAVIVQTPNFFGVIEKLDEVSNLIHKNKSLLIVSVDPISLGLLKPPGEYGADIVVGEGQSMGNFPSFGGPYLGFLSATKALMRKMPGRIVGETTDNEGKRGFVLTLQAREQHIRREKATSNICSNQSLNAMAAAIYLTTLGKKGIKEVAMLCLQKSHYAMNQLIATGKFVPVFKAPFFKEFTVKSTLPVKDINKELLNKKIIGGFEIEKDYPEFSDCMLLAVTEKRTKEEIDLMVETIKGIEQRR
ncbi:MAG TPA: aminomethyl-transferring glycine dehydrogenase subunit GcvPA [Clostridiaceae bacterium]|nr:aminomethyl-transferring glycine dehydrogenase subunit GcvPA [Clostridiaceae bacterium]